MNLLQCGIFWFANVKSKSFNTRLNLFSGTDPYSEDQDDMSPDCITMKPAIAFLVGKNDEDLHDSPIWGTFTKIAQWSKDRQFEMKMRIKTGMIMLFKHIYERLRNECKILGVYVTSITMTLPCRWNITEYWDMYTETLRAGFCLNEEDHLEVGPGNAASTSPKVEFLNESESHFHYIFSDEISRRTVLQEYLTKRQHRMFVLLDMGGFSAVGPLVCLLLSLYSVFPAVHADVSWFDAEYLRIRCYTKA